MTSINNPSTTSNRSEGIVFQTQKDLIDIFDTEFKKTPDGLVFEQGGFLTQGPKGWELYVPKKIVRLKASSDIDDFSDINFGFYGRNRSGEEGILLKISKLIPAYVDPVFKQVYNYRKGTPVLQTVFFTTDQIILQNHESFREFILRLDHNGTLAHLDETGLKALLDETKYVEPIIDNTTGDITDEYKYVSLVLEIETLGTPREILHGKNWREAHRTNKYVHTHLPTSSRWNDLIRKFLNDERDNLNTPTDILGLQHDINRLNAPQGASSTIVMFESDRTARVMRSFMMDFLSSEEQKDLLSLARKHRTSLTRDTGGFYHNELREVVRFYELVKKATVEGLPNSINKPPDPKNK